MGYIGEKRSRYFAIYENFYNLHAKLWLSVYPQIANVNLLVTIHRSTPFFKS